MENRKTLTSTSSGKGIVRATIAGRDFEYGIKPCAFYYPQLFYGYWVPFALPHTVPSNEWPGPTVQRRSRRNRTAPSRAAVSPEALTPLLNGQATLRRSATMAGSSGAGSLLHSCWQTCLFSRLDLQR